MRLLTHSRAKDYKLCPKKHFIAYELGYRSVRAAEPLLMGSVFHSGTAEPYWRARKAGESLQAATVAAMEGTSKQCQVRELDLFLAAKMKVMAMAYTSAWNLRPDVRCLAVEESFNLPLFNGIKESAYWRRAGKIDAVLELEDKRIALCEHKTSAMDTGPGSDYRRRLNLDEQISIYFDAVRALGYQPDLVIYDVVKKPTQRPRLASPAATRYKKDGTLKANCREQDETPDEFFDRVLAEMSAKGITSMVDCIEVYRSNAQQEEFNKVLLQTAQLMRFSIDNGVCPQNSDACFQYGNACAYLDVCEGHARLEDPARFYIPATAHPELEEVTSEE